MNDTNERRPLLLLFMKAMVKKQIWVPGYTKRNGQVVAGAHKWVNVSNDEHDEHKIVAGQGTVSQKKAHEKLSKQAWWADASHEHKVAHVLHEGTKVADEKYMTDQLSRLGSNLIKGKKTLTGEWAAYHVASADKKAALLAKVKAAGKEADLTSGYEAWKSSNPAKVKEAEELAASVAEHAKPLPAGEHEHEKHEPGSPAHEAAKKSAQAASAPEPKAEPKPEPEKAPEAPKTLADFGKYSPVPDAIAHKVLEDAGYKLESNGKGGFNYAVKVQGGVKKGSIQKDPPKDQLEILIEQTKHAIPDLNAMNHGMLGGGQKDAGPHEGDTKPAADGGTLVLKDGHWVKQGGDKPADEAKKESTTTRGDLPTAPDGDENLAKKVRKIQDFALAGDADGLAAYYDRLLEPKAKDYAKDVVAHMASKEKAEPKKKDSPKVVGSVDSDMDAHLKAIASAKLPDSNTAAKSVNAKLDSIERATRAKDIDALLMMGYGAKGYGAKAADLANQSLELLGASERVKAGQKAAEGYRTEAQIAAAKRNGVQSRLVDVSRDSLMTAIAKLGGIRRGDAKRAWGYGNNDMKGVRVGIKPVFSDRGLSLDRMGEALHELGYLKSDENGRFEGAELEEHVSNGLSGSHHFTAEGYAQKAEKDYHEHYQGLTSHDVSESGFDDLPIEAQHAIEEFLDEQPKFTPEELEFFGRMASLAADFEREAVAPDAGAEGTGHGSFDEADDQTRGSAEKPVTRQPGEDDEPVREPVREPGSDDEDGPRDGERNADGLVFRDGRWHRDEDELVTVAHATAGAPGHKIPAPPKVSDADLEFPVKIAADSIGELRKPDVLRVLSQNFDSHGFSRADFARYITEKRPDLAQEVDEVMRDELGEPDWNSTESAAETAAEKDFGDAAATPDVTSTTDENKPSDSNYRYADTGYIAGSRKELAAEMIGRAKKEGARVYETAIDWNALEQNPREAKELITKSNLFGKVDWNALRAGGMEPGAGFLVDRIYAAIGQEPSADSMLARQDYVTGLQSLRDRLEACKTASDVAAVLDTLRDEYDGFMLTADESAKYEEHAQKSHELYGERKALDEERTKTYNEVQRARSGVYAVESEIEKRERRKWAPKSEHAQQLEEAKKKHEAATKTWGDTIARTKDRLEEIDAQRQAHGEARDWIRVGAKARNQLENPMHRAWQLMGDRFLGVIRYRSYKGSDAFQNHVATAKAGKIDWSWLDKEQMRAPKSTQESARFQLQVADTFERVGGRHVTADSTAALKEMFNLRDVQSGNWVLRDFSSAKFHVEQTAAAFADLADLLGAEDGEVSMKGRLAMAFGARGHGKAMAHYEPVHRVINMTKMKGGGALAHEWFHALDNMAKEAEGMGKSGVDDFVTLNPDLLPHGELRDAVIGLRSAMLEGNHYASAPIQYSASDVRIAKRNVDREGAGRVGAMIKNAGNVHDAVRAVDAYLGPKNGQKLKGRYKTAHEDWRRIAAAHYGGNEEGGEISVKAGAPMSAFAMEARILDNGSSKSYWAGTEEMAARAFQSWVEDSLAAKGRRNDYLSTKADNKHYFDPLTGMQFRPFPEGEERTRINAAFDKFVVALKKSNTLQKAIRVVGASEWAKPSAAQAKAGNYKKPRVKWNGLDLAIENPAGSTREWGGGKTTMKNDYGYVCKSEGMDGDAVDVYVGPNESASHVYVVHQRKAGDWDAYDEDKAMLGFDSEDDAKAAYLRHYDDPRFLGPITAMPVDEFVSKVRATKGNPAMIKCLFLKAVKLSDTMRDSIGEVGSKHRQDMPADAFLEGAERKYPVKTRVGGRWVYSRKLLQAAAARARMQGRDDLASRAAAILVKL